MESEETAIGCCPRYEELLLTGTLTEHFLRCSGYQCAQDAELQTCTTTVQSGGSVPVVTCSNGYSENFSELTIPAIATLATTSNSTSSVPTITPASTTMSGQSGTQYLMRSPGELNGLRSPQEASLPSPQERDLSWSQEGVLVSPQELDSVPPQELAGIKIERYDDE